MLESDEPGGTFPDPVWDAVSIRMGMPAEAWWERCEDGYRSVSIGFRKCVGEFYRAVMPNYGVLRRKCVDLGCGAGSPS